MPSTFPTEVYLESSELGSQVIIGMFIFQFLMSFLAEGAVTGFMWYLRTLQLIIHLPMLAIPFPANAISFFQFIVPLV